MPEKTIIYERFFFHAVKSTKIPSEGGVNRIKIEFPHSLVNLSY